MKQQSDFLNNKEIKTLISSLPKKEKYGKRDSYHPLEDKLIMMIDDNKFLSVTFNRTETGIIKRRERLRKSQASGTLSEVKVESIKLPKIKFDSKINVKKDLILKVYNKIRQISTEKISFTKEEDEIIATTNSNIKCAILTNRSISSVATRRRILKLKGENVVEANSKLGVKNIIKQLKQEKFDFNKYLKNNNGKEDFEIPEINKNQTDRFLNALWENTLLQEKEKEIEVKQEVNSEEPLVSTIGINVLLNGKKITIPSGVIVNIEGKLTFE